MRSTTLLRFKLKNLVKSKWPRLDAWLLRPILEWRYHRYIRGLDSVESEVIREFGLVVQSGPFKGMKYFDVALHSGFAPKILGCYEAEILPAIQEAISRDYKTILNVGSAEGYYAVGMACVMPKSTVYAFDVDTECQALCASLSNLNGVSSMVKIAGWCDHSVLKGIEGDRVLLISDCEGYELDLLDPREVPALLGWDILVELHDPWRPGITPTILSRFRDSHDIRLIDCARRNPRDYPIVNFLKKGRERQLALDDRRATPQQWAWMKSHRVA